MDLLHANIVDAVRAASGNDVVALLHQPLADILDEFIHLKRWKEQLEKEKAEEEQRTNRMLSKLCVSSHPSPSH